MDYSHASYYPPPVQQYPYFDIPPTNDQTYTAQEERITNPIVSLVSLNKASQLLAKPH